ncbi:hypothetical protein FRACYDRAFT_184300 [Fragilariopsis cylindrus CCMP1102]|uniref:TraB-domain-containing protein n=1 Tax=Fragilariopsis cylindrus CCMP1102 TaxID=635003 RepID=A0A1E7FIW5_9STRA|nr:hypothetical protein FRACYDRAFT_184300 [Fragilariopsis cylindrus CCMP1102]|eukprot:OEU17985.1 hypothetical protein FRACYDRAFT_184300 [Fragilariopsis cylindrus CCMP1102]
MATNTATEIGIAKPLSESILGPNNRQILEFIEPSTNVTVLLIGSMHYNPASISLVENTLEELGSTNKLGSVIIESCDIRWNKTQEILDKNPNPNDKDFLGNEMRAAWEISSLKYNRPTILGDQRINVTVDALKASFKDTVQDIFIRGPNGWKHSLEEIQEGWSQTTPINNDNLLPSEKNQGLQGLNALSFLDPRLLISLPVSLVKYPLSFFLKDPIPFGLFFSSIIASTTASDLLSSQLQPERTFADYILSVSFAILETVVFARLLLKPLLAERNDILAKSILDQCKIYSTTATTNGGNDNNNWFQQFFKLDSKSRTSDSDPSITYVPGCSPSEMNGGVGEGGERPVVVAVLGMAHCNGIMKLLKEQKV